MTEPYRLPTATVVAARFDGDVATITIELSREDYLSYPIAPADLREDNPFRRVFPFHQLVGRMGPRLEFETYNVDLALPTVGGVLSFCSWWTRQGIDAVRDLNARWELRDYPDNGDHDHCLLTFETLSAYQGERQGYVSQHGWVTVAAYHEFIASDATRIRRQPRTCESPT